MLALLKSLKWSREISAQPPFILLFYYYYRLPQAQFLKTQCNSVTVPTDCSCNTGVTGLHSQSSEWNSLQSGSSSYISLCFHVSKNLLTSLGLWPLSSILKMSNQSHPVFRFGKSKLIYPSLSFNIIISAKFLLSCKIICSQILGA